MLEISHLSFSYGKGEEVLHDVSISLPDSSIGILLGPNGSGKSTLIKIVCGALKAKEGTISLDGKDLLKMPLKDRAKHAAYVPQLSVPLPYSVRETVMLGRIPHLRLLQSQEGEKVVDELLAELNLLPIAKEPLGSISGGQMQMALIARALASEAKLIVLDEPTNNLDISREIEVLNILKRLQKDKGVSFLVSMHDISLALELGERFYLLKNGRILHEGTEEAISPSSLKEVFDVDFEESVDSRNKKRLLWRNE